MTTAPIQRRWPINAAYLAAFGMITCGAAVLIQFLLWFFPTLDPRGMLLACALAALEAMLSFWLIKRLPTAQRQTAWYRGTEVLILLVALKFFTELRSGTASFWSNFLLWSVAFPSNILNLHYILTALPVMAAWYAGTLFAADLFLLGSAEAASLDERSKTTPVRDLILRRFLTLGMAVILLAGIPLQRVFPTSRPAEAAIAPAASAYFVLGIVLLSLTRYASLETTWLEAKLAIPAQIPRRWFATSALILAVLVFLISWLPTNYGLGLFDTLNAVFHIITQAFITLFSLLGALIVLLAGLFGKSPASPPNRSQFQRKRSQMGNSRQYQPARSTGT